MEDPEAAGSKRDLFIEPTRDESWELLSQGAEARVWKVPYCNSSNSTVHIVAKERFPKKYRHPTLDSRLTRQRSRFESRILKKCASAGLCVPRVLSTKDDLLYLEALTGPTVRNGVEATLDRQQQQQQDEEATSKNSDKDELLRVARNMGKMVGQLHQLGIVHGDLTTSNFMWHTEDHDNGTESDQPKPQMYLIDFGLATHTKSVEARAVDLVVWERAIEATHPRLPFEEFLAAFVTAYESKAPDAAKVQGRWQQVRQRGRKRDCFG